MADVHPNLKDIANELAGERDGPYVLTPEEMAEDDIDVYVLKEDANTVLFAGSTLAIIAAVFISISFKRLLPDPSVQFVQQLVAEIVAAQNPSVTAITISIDKPGPSISAYIINGLWLLSLIAFIYSAGGAALLKVWIAKYVRQNHCCRSGVERFRALFTYRHVTEYEDEYEEDRLMVSLDNAAASIFEVFHSGISLFILGFIIFLCTISFILAAVMSFVMLTAVSAYFRLSVLPLEDKMYPFYHDTPLTAHLFKTDKLKPKLRRRARSSKRSGHAKPTLPRWNTSLDISDAPDCRPRYACLAACDESEKIAEP